jgi:hypothetical protein
MGSAMDDRFDEILEEMRIERAEWHAQTNRRLDQTDENLRFLGELNRRSEIVFQDVVRELREMRGEIRASTETTKAHTRAIFAVIDRLEGGNGGIAPAT